MQEAAVEAVAVKQAQAHLEQEDRAVELSLYLLELFQTLKYLLMVVTDLELLQ
jgi:hypothetical protein